MPSQSPAALSAAGSNLRRVVHYPTLALSWVSALMMLGWGIVMALNGPLASYALLTVADYMSEDRFGRTLIFVASIRIIAVLINGRAIVLSSTMRALMAGIGVVVWVQFTYGFLALAVKAGIIGIGIPTCLLMSGADLYSCLRSVITIAREHKWQRHVVA